MSWYIYLTYVSIVIFTSVLALEIASSFVVAFISHPIPFFFFHIFFKLEADKANYLEVSLFATGSILHVAICWWGSVLVLFLGNFNKNELKLVQLMPWYVNSVWPGDAIWRHRSGSTLAHVMACCLSALSHYHNQCSLIISEVFGGGQFHWKGSWYLSLIWVWKLLIWNYTHIS